MSSISLCISEAGIRITSNLQTVKTSTNMDTRNSQNSYSHGRGSVLQISLEMCGTIRLIRGLDEKQTEACTEVLHEIRGQRLPSSRKHNTCTVYRYMYIYITSLSCCENTIALVHACMRIINTFLICRERDRVWMWSIVRYAVNYAKWE